MTQIASVQILRGIAALTVAFGHIQHDAKVQSLKLAGASKPAGAFETVHWLPWNAGVDLFFVISGFVMVYASERLFARSGAAGEFLGRRIARIAPLYWMLTALYLLILLRGSWSEARALPSLADVAASFAFWPTDAFGDGAPRPILILGWTLNYEMFFYALFALFIGLARERAVLCVALALGGLVVLGAAVPPGAPAPFFWTRPIVLEFALGRGLALLLRRGVCLPAGWRGLLLLIGVAVLLADPLRSSTQPLDWIVPNDALRVLGWGVPASLVVAACVLGREGQPVRAGCAGTLLGDASYALYLVHPFVIIGVRKAWLAAGLHDIVGFWPMVGASLLLSCGAALIVHRRIELPLTRWAQARLIGRAPAPAVA